MERPLSETTDLFTGKTILAIETPACNKTVFRFTDGSAVALHIECDQLGLPDVLTCTDCVDKD